MTKGIGASKEGSDREVESDSGIESAGPNTVITDTRIAIDLADPQAGIITEADLIRAAYPDAITICTETFMNVSKDHYQPPWLVREIVQNFVDGNTRHPASLDGVEFIHAYENGKHHFRITGKWPFHDPTGLITLHSGKVNSQVRIAGGNGIGLKQTILRLIRDFKVDQFSVEGEGWKVTYFLADKNVANQKISGSKTFNGSQIENDWLMAKVEKSKNTEECSYIIETKNSDIARYIDEFPNLGVSGENEYLQNPDYENKHGSFKWIPKTADSDPANPVKGRLFINGQVMNYGKKGETNETYWDGPEYVNIKLNNLQYNMSIDRPPVSNYELQSYLYELISYMETNDIIEQLKKSEYLWANQKENNSWNKKAYEVVIWSFLQELSRRKFVNFGMHFDKEKYFYQDHGLSEKDKEKLISDGLIICPDYFILMGLSPASSMLDAFDLAKKNKPSPAQMDHIMREHGLNVGFLALSKIDTSEQFFNLFKENFGPESGNIELVNAQEGKVRINFLTNFDNRSFFNQMIHPPKTAEAKKMYLLRGIIAYGLKNGVFTDAVISNGKCYATFSLDKVEDQLFTKVVEAPLAAGLHLEVNKKYLNQFLESSSGEKSKQEKSFPKFPNLRRYFLRLAYVCMFVAGAAGLKLAIDKAPQIAQWAQKTDRDNIYGKEIDQSRRLEDYDKEIDQSRRLEDYDKEIDKWRRSGNYGRRVENLGKKNLSELLRSYNTSGVKATDSGHAHGSIKRTSEAQHTKDFQIVKNPTPIELEQLNLLRSYVVLTTEIEVPNDLVIYTGEGTLGINFGKKTIALNRKLFSINFDEALMTFIHEIAHNAVTAHNSEFSRVNSVLLTAINNRLMEIAEKLDLGKPLTKEERLILSIEKEWDRLR